MYKPKYVLWTTSAGGRQAIDRLEQGHIDMAVVDLRMPEIGGIEVLRAIRAADPDCQVVLMSGDATIDSAVEAVKLGAIDYLTKPFDIGRLKGLMRTVHDEFERRRKLLEIELPRETVHRQLVLGEPEHGWRDADRAVDRARFRFGADAIRPASLLG